jgi:hypothetical protein
MTWEKSIEKIYFFVCKQKMHHNDWVITTWAKYVSRIVIQKEDRQGQGLFASCNHFKPTLSCLWG